MDILKLRDSVISDYRKYVESFLDIRDEDIREKARGILEGGTLWPDPLLECNPGFEKGETIDELIEGGVLHEEMKHIFTGYHLHRHQAEAIKLGSSGQEFIVTSGTGSGKSLTYLGTIFNSVLRMSGPERKGVKAIIVYPMNALINSQEEEIRKFADRYEKAVDGKTFPITFGKYTGQEGNKAKEKILNDPPNILLTNYMMLELLLTRSREAELRRSIFAQLRFLVFDELHTYRGRQGADVALLIRRMKAQAHHSLACMGTSATLSSGSLSQQRKDVIHLGKQLFDADFTPQQIIGETLQAHIKRDHPTRRELADVLQKPLPTEAMLADLEVHPLASWMERNVALADNEGTLVRGKPQTVEQISKQLEESSGVDSELCKERISEFLQLLQCVNRELDDGILPFRIHQFVAQTGTIRVTLEPMGDREITASEERATFRNGRELPTFPVVFSRQSGLSYIRVIRKDGELKPWEGKMEVPQDGSGEYGYLLLNDPEDEPLWDEGRKSEFVPDTWLEKKKSGEERVRKDRDDALPKKIWFDAKGNYSKDIEKPVPNGIEGWFMTAPLLMDPLSGVIYNSQTREFNKLAQLGDAGRSASTTILTYDTLRQLNAQKVNKRVEKVMSFTDNRQDAALQTGHFNDFMRRAFVRSAINKAISKHDRLDSSNIASAVFDELHLPQEAFAEIPGTRPHQVRENEDAFKKWLLHELFYDLQRGWRHRFPNLEQCGLLEISYKNLRDQCLVDEYWEKSDLLVALTPEKRFEFIRQFLNYFRGSFAVQDHELERNTLEESRNRMRQRLQSKWTYREKEPPDEPCWMRVVSCKSKRLKTLSIGPASSLGKYVRFFAKQYHTPLNHSEVEEELQKLLQCFTEAGYLHQNTTTEEGGIPLYRLKLSTVEWVQGDPGHIVPDAVRNRSAKERKIKPNGYFRELYSQSPDQLRKMVAGEHTAQVSAEMRQQLERDFRKAHVKALYCSPTMELGIDIDELAVVHMRNVPPNPANYAQRSGRAGRKGQGALIFTFCSAHSSHDQHFFRNKMDMVTGKVTPQVLDLTNPELLRAHLNALYLSECRIRELSHGLAEILDVNDPDLPILPDIEQQLRLPEEAIDRIEASFVKIVGGLQSRLEEQSWYDPTWIRDAIDEVPQRFSEACQRWRDLYTEAFEAKNAAAAVLRGADMTKQSPDFKRATNTVQQSQRKLDLLRNKTEHNEYSEFYPYRYFASEGLLPGYDFTRLPVRMFLADRQNGGVYVSRPRFLALEEFGPRNILYQNGSKWRVGKMILPPSGGALGMKTLRIDKDTGIYSLADGSRVDVDAFSGNARSERGTQDILPNLVELQDMTGWAIDRISCQEDERTRTGFITDIGVAVRKDSFDTEMITAEHTGERALTIRFLKAAQLVKLNKQRTRGAEGGGFMLHTQTGLWKSGQDYIKADKDERALFGKVRLYTTMTADCLYITPGRLLQLGRNGVLTLMYALKRALEEQYQVEPRELDCKLLGDLKRPNILFYEATEGSLGVLSRLGAEPAQLELLIEKAWDICRFDAAGNDPDAERLPATYDDLLSYYNQSFHADIDRFEIRKALEILKRSEVSIRPFSPVLASNQKSPSHEH